MKITVSIIAAFVGLMVTLTSAVPLYEEDLQPYQQYQQYQQYEPYQAYDQYQQYGQIRERRSPQQSPPPPPPPPPQPNRGSFSMSGGHTSGQGGFVRGDYNHKIWEGRNGARVDANTYYQRNWGTPGPRQDYGGGVRLTVPLGGRRH